MATIKGGDKIRKVLDSTVSKLYPGYVEVGFPSGASYPEADGGLPVALVAALNEYGHRIGAAPAEGQPDHRQSVPPRPFFRNMIAKKKARWPKQMATLLKNTNYDVNATLEMMGQEVSGQLVESIDALKTPPLAASTIARKGFDKPLIDTGTMRKSVTYNVKT